MNLWQAREKSLEWLSNELIEQKALLDQGFELLDESIALLNQYGKEPSNEQNDRFASVINLTLAKTRNLLLGSYGMMLDALAQEAGALLRLILEAYELLVYFRLDPTRADQAIDGNLPQPGEIAKRIKGEFQDLRGYLNTHASHLHLSYESISHLLDYQTFEIKAVQDHRVEVFNNNLITLNAVQVLVVAEAIRCLNVIGYSPNLLIDKFEDWRLKSIKAPPPPSKDT
ncbi:MAG TPA: hypothetical protein VJ987_12535 [Anaerolineales bacterium]|nr:hypothetical protein [Anaerolineales bacterium]